jgi:2-deoxy-D-gluconate 3-dehydrogenase
MIDLYGQTVLIAGGMDAVAHGVAVQTHQAGASVVLGHDGHPQQAERADQIGQAVSGEAVELPVLDPDALAERLETLDALHTVVINPRWYAIGPFVETTPAEWDAALEANFESAVYTAQAAAAHMIQRKVAGSIVFLSTTAVHLPTLDTSALATSLAALYPVAKMAAVDCGPHGIRVNTVTLGWVDSDWTAPYLAGDGRAYVERDIPLGTVGTPEAVGDVCCFLASPRARYITGAMLPVDGGYTLTRGDNPAPYPAVE